MDSKNSVSALRNQISLVCFKDRRTQVILKIQVSAAIKGTDLITDLLGELTDQTCELTNAVESLKLKAPIESGDLIQLNEILILGKSLIALRASWIDSLLAHQQADDFEQELELLRDTIAELNSALELMEAKYFPDESIAQSVLKLIERK